MENYMAFLGTRFVQQKKATITFLLGGRGQVASFPSYLTECT